MRTMDFSPLYRTMVGFDRLADMIDTAAKQEPVAAIRLTISNSWASMSIGSNWRWPASPKAIWTFRFRKMC
jgi:hypothetical protein